MPDRLLQRLKAMDTGVKIALALFLGSMVLLAVPPDDAPGPPPERSERAARAPQAAPPADPEDQARARAQAVLDALPGKLRIEDTGLHWLAITTMDFPQGLPMDVEAVGGELFVVTRDGALTWYDPEQETFREVAAVEMRREALRDSPISEMEGFKFSWFRASGLLVEPVGEGFRAYVSHHVFEDDCFWVRISTLDVRIEDGEPVADGTWTPLYTAAPCIRASETAGHPFGGMQAGGRMVEHGPGDLLLTIGDHELDGHSGPAAPLDPASPYGKIMLVDKRTGEARIFASGSRNAQGLLRTADGRILATEHGPKGGDELNLIEDGASYGWPLVTYGILYGYKPWPLAETQGRHEGYTKPLFAWVPSIGISNLAEPAPGQFDHWQGDLIVTSLKKQSLYRLRIEDGRVIYDEPIPIGHRIRDIETLPGGAFVLITDDRKLILLTDAGPAFGPNLTKREVAVALPFVVRAAGGGEDEEARSASLSGEQLFEERCASCHGLDGEIEVSVPLDGLFQRQIGSFPGYAYSDVLARDQRQWDRHQLRVFLLKPDQKFAGTTMPDPNLSRDQAFALSRYLAQFKADQ